MTGPFSSELQHALVAMAEGSVEHVISHYSQLEDSPWHVEFKKAVKVFMAQQTPAAAQAVLDLARQIGKIADRMPDSATICPDLANKNAWAQLIQDAAIEMGIEMGDIKQKLLDSYSLDKLLVQ